MLHRRHLLLGGLCACCLPLTRTRASSFILTEVAPGIHVRRGVDEDASPGNADAIANAGFIVGQESVLVFDPGGSLGDGAALRAMIREKTQLPIRTVVLNHVHPDHIFGAGAFLEDKPDFIGHARLPAALAARGDYYKQRLEEILGAGAAGPVVMPTLDVADAAEVDLGERVVRLKAHGPAHTDNDLSVFDAETGTLFPSDLLFVGRVPALDGSLNGWLAELEALKRIGAARAVPGHGPEQVNWPAGAADLERYLRTLVEETRQAVRDNIGIEAAVEQVAAGERGRWTLFDAYHGRNVTQAYKELEWE
ncbi:quinoprotein relay system zinc metallohydrolase 2 [Dongia deserti]|uniref:quinoprotein relay system zinc metallohydrolase 2 n=1 Tax=Dongia deserti TaxID=2268030 RepID=UPI000E64F0FD|nr:quinoprotein relay system zinc metallohydrolase 2 [Dongia deserti]